MWNTSTIPGLLDLASEELCVKFTSHSEDVTSRAFERCADYRRQATLRHQRIITASTVTIDCF